MNADDLAEVIEDLLRAAAEDEDGDAEELQGARLVSFRRVGLLTRDAGVVITLADGSEYQVTVVQARIGHDEEGGGQRRRRRRRAVVGAGFVRSILSGPLLAAGHGPRCATSGDGAVLGRVLFDLHARRPRRDRRGPLG